MMDERELDLMDGLRRAIGIARWMSGSKDFAPEGQAGEGWVKARTELNDIEKLINRVSAATATRKRQQPESSKRGKASVFRKRVMR